MDYSYERFDGTFCENDKASIFGLNKKTNHYLYGNMIL